MTNEQILKKEGGLTYWSGLFIAKRGDLVLTKKDLSFQIKEKQLFCISLKDIISVNCKKGIGTGNENMFIFYKLDGKEKRIKIQHSSLMSLATIGNLSRLSGSYFASWEQAINDARSGRWGNNEGSLDDLEKLAELKKKGVLTEEEFSAKKKQLLGI
ncbi:MAG: hypothetical protein JWP09_951 [Candidatus Taylorbacteria bacterium]|nr:hypothetical protein [Candidatus Taylorbacteria bacterium]